MAAVINPHVGRKNMLVSASLGGESFLPLKSKSVWTAAPKNPVFSPQLCSHCSGIIIILIIYEFNAKNSNTVKETLLGAESIKCVLRYCITPY